VDCVQVDIDIPFKTIQYCKQFPYHLNMSGTGCHKNCVWVLNMFRTLIHPSSGACDFSVVSPHWLCVLVSMCVGVSVWLG